MRRNKDFPHKASDLRPAPGDLAIVQAFVNTGDRRSGADDLASPAALASWLASRRLAAETAGLEDADVERAVEVREALRALLLANNGGPDAGGAAIYLDEVAAELPVVVRFDTAGVARLEPRAGDLDGVLAQIFAIVGLAQAEGLWHRLKACASDDCGAAFYDTSSNLAGKWCSMRRCGNRRNARRSQRVRRTYYKTKIRELRASRTAAGEG